MVVIRPLNHDFCIITYYRYEPRDTLQHANVVYDGCHFVVIRNGLQLGCIHVCHISKIILQCVWILNFARTQQILEPQMVLFRRPSLWICHAAPWDYISSPKTATRYRISLSHAHAAWRLLSFSLWNNAAFIRPRRELFRSIARPLSINQNSRTHLRKTIRAILPTPEGCDSVKVRASDSDRYPSRGVSIWNWHCPKWRPCHSLKLGTWSSFKPAM